MQKQLIGERLYPKVAQLKFLHTTGLTDAKVAGRITGMMLELENRELHYLLDNEEQLLTMTLEECLALLALPNQSEFCPSCKSRFRADGSCLC